jgi:hypothetical protein
VRQEDGPIFWEAWANGPSFSDSVVHRALYYDGERMQSLEGSHTEEGKNGPTNAAQGPIRWANIDCSPNRKALYSETRRTQSPEGMNTRVSYSSFVRP